MTELIASDLKMIEAMFEVLQTAAGVEHVEHVAIGFRGGGDDTIIVGYGEQAEPAVLAIAPQRSGDLEGVLAEMFKGDKFRGK